MMGLDFDFGDSEEFEFPWKENWLEGKVLPEGYQVWFTDGYRSLGWCVCVPGKVGVQKQVGQYKGHSYLLSSVSCTQFIQDIIS